jgi:hypothetical protein
MPPDVTDAERETRALLAAAAPWPWKWWTSNSFRRLTGPDGRDGGVLCGAVQTDGQPDVCASEGTRNLIERAPELLEQLLADVAVIRGERDAALAEVEQLQGAFRGVAGASFEHGKTSGRTEVDLTTLRGGLAGLAERLAAALEPTVRECEAWKTVEDVRAILAALGAAAPSAPGQGATS